MTASNPKAAEGIAAPTTHAHRHHGSHHHSHHGSSFSTMVSHAAHGHAARKPLTPEVTGALKTAMSKEGVPEAWEHPLQIIIGQESNGQVGAANHTDTARGLFQLTRSSYHLNPNGAQSFGNPVEEAQGGIRYIQQRYQSADNAMDFWQKHGWY